MQTLKTAVVVVLLLVVFYGVYEMLNRPPDEPPPGVAELPELTQPEIDFGNLDDGSAFDQVLSVPAESATAHPAVSRPAAPVAQPPAQYGTYAPPGFSDQGPPLNTAPPLTSQLPRDAQNGPPSATSPAPPSLTTSSSASLPTVGGSRSPAASGFPVADTAITNTLPGNPHVQNNPFLHEDVTTKPSDLRGDDRQIGARAYEQALKMAKSQLAEDDHHAALSTLSVWYKSQDLTAEEHRELLNLLDPLAGRVVYSREHLVEPPYRVRRNETLADIARQYDVPPQLLQKINGIENPNVLLPGSELKVLHGPFRGDVDLQAQELTVFLNQLYAGRFPITVGRDPEPTAGEFQVRDKQLEKAYFSMDGRTIPAESPANPFGHVWLDLGREVCIHGSPMGGAQQQRGCISLSPRDAEDVYSILSIGSTVRILR